MISQPVVNRSRHISCIQTILSRQEDVMAISRNSYLMISVNSHQYISSQWPFQDPRLEVPTIYKAYFPTCQVRVVRFYVSCFLLVLVLLLLLPLLVLLLLLLLSSLLLSSPRLLSSSPLLLLPAGLQPRPSTPSVPCRTSTTTIHAQCSLPDLNREYPGPVFPAGPEPRPSTPSVPCRTSTASIHAKRYAT